VQSLDSLFAKVDVADMPAPELPPLTPTKDPTHGSTVLRRSGSSMQKGSLPL
jgi:hypothetical protein